MDTAPPSPLHPILNDIARSFESGLFYVAISLSLTVPDICSSLATGKDDELRFRIEQRYVAWCEKYLEPHFKIFTGKDCWALRGGVVHNGMLFGHAKARYDRVFFTLPSSIQIHECLSSNNGGIKETALQMDAKIFCQTMIDSAISWLDEMSDNETVKSNLKNLVRMRVEGLAPHMVGIPVIA